jgi:hypothetical protein
VPAYDKKKFLKLCRFQAAYPILIIAQEVLLLTE